MSKREDPSRSRFEPYRLYAGSGRVGPRAGLATLVVLAVVATRMVGAVPAATNLAKSIVAGGGGRSASPGFVVHGTVGQSITGPVTGDGIRVRGGFWPGRAAATPGADPTGETPSPETSPTATNTPVSSATASASSGPPPTADPTAGPSTTPGGIARWAVNTTDDVVDGACDASHCSLREALAAAGAHSGADEVTFAISEADPGYDAGIGVWRIRPVSAGYDVPADTVVDGSIAPSPVGATAAAGPRIEIDGTDLGSRGITGLRLADRATVRGLIVNRFQYGVHIGGDDVSVEGCYVGTDPTGTAAEPNSSHGILVSSAAEGVLIAGNLLSGNGGCGVRLHGASTRENTLRDNLVGTNVDGTAALANAGCGVLIATGAHDNTVEGNIVSGNGSHGIHVLDSGTDRNVIRNNRVGTNADGALGPGNGGFGVALFDGPRDNTIGPGNTIASSALDGVLVDGSSSFTSTVGNSIVANSITSNGRRGIKLGRGGNAEIPPPRVASVEATRASGTACAGCIVEVFSDAADEGAVFEGRTTANTDGAWTLAKPGGFTGPHLTATATDAEGNTSAFGAPAAIPGTTPGPGTTVPTAAATVTATRTPVSTPPGGPSRIQLPWAGRKGGLPGR